MTTRPYRSTRPYRPQQPDLAIPDLTNTRQPTDSRNLPFLRNWLETDFVYLARRIPPNSILSQPPDTFSQSTTYIGIEPFLVSLLRYRPSQSK